MTLAYDNSDLDHAILTLVADARHNLHRNHATSRPLSENYERVGLEGEYECACYLRWHGIMVEVDTASRPGGDGRADFRVGGVTVDVKTARKAYNLLREAEKPHADILVLAAYKNDRATLLGWEYDEAMVACPSKDFGYGIVNHYMAAHELKSIGLLPVAVSP